MSWGSLKVANFVLLSFSCLQPCTPGCTQMHLAATFGHPLLHHLYSYRLQILATY